MNSFCITHNVSSNSANHNLVFTPDPECQRVEVQIPALQVLEEEYQPESFAPLDRKWTPLRHLRIEVALLRKCLLHRVKCRPVARPRPPQVRVRKAARRLGRPYTSMPTGIVKFYQENKGYGFIVDDDTGIDIFVHISDVQSAGLERLHAGNVVSYEIGSRGAQPKVVEVRLIGRAAAI